MDLAAGEQRRNGAALASVRHFRFLSILSDEKYKGICAIELRRLF
jgi:hypothetical protein